MLIDRFLDDSVPQKSLRGVREENLPQSSLLVAVFEQTLLVNTPKL